MNFGSLSLLREEARRKRAEKNGKGGSSLGGSGEKRSGSSREEDEPDKKKSRTGDDRTSELLRELRDMKKKNADELGHGKNTDPTTPTATEGVGEPAAAAVEEEVEDEEGRKKDIQVMLKLRQFGQPICLFAETAKQRVERLKAIEEQMKEKMTDAELRVLTNIDKAEELRKKREQEKESAAASAAAGLDPKDGKPSGDASSDDDVEAEGDDGGDGKGKKPPIDKTCKEEVVRKYLKGLLKEWEAEFAAKSTKEFLESHRGKLAAVTLKQCRESVSYLFDLLRQRTVPEDVVDHLDKIVEFMKKREYVLATDEYLKIAIGNAAWPMGVTMVGIHERAGRERIFTQKVARLLQTHMSFRMIGCSLFLFSLF